MTITGINPRHHIASGFDPSNIFSGILPVDTVFSAFAAVQVLTADLAETRQIMGTFLTGVGGWAINRVPTINPDEFDWEFLTYDGATPNTQALRGSAAASIEHAILNGMDVDVGGNALSVRLNGVQMEGTGVPAYAQGGAFSLGGDPATGFGTKEGIIGAGYKSGALLSTTEWEALFRTFKRTNDFNGPDMPELSHMYRSTSLVRQEGLALSIPATWVNGGTAGVAGDLARTDGPAVLDFRDDNNPAFASATLLP